MQNNFVIFTNNICIYKFDLYICITITKLNTTMQAKNSKNLSDFNAAWNAIPRSLQPKVREEIKAEAYIDTDWKFNDRRKGRVEPREIEAIGIIKVFAKYGIDARTGKQLQKAVS